MNNKKNIEKCVLLLIIFLIYTFMIKFIDVKAIGPENTSVGFASLNEPFHNLFGYNSVLYLITKVLGIVALMFVAFYGFIGLVQLIKKKNLFKVNKDILILGVFYIIVLATYIFFEKVVINYRPVILDEGLEASFPSSHTILGLFVCFSGIMINERIIKQKYRKNLNIFLKLLGILILVGRLFSGVHWLTDIMAGVLISCALVNLLKFALRVEE